MFKKIVAFIWMYVIKVIKSIANYIIKVCKKIIKYITDFCKWLRNYSRIIVIIFLILLSLILFVGGYFADIKINTVKEQQNIVNTIAQIQVAIVALVITMMSITTTFLNEDIYGVKLKDVLKLRHGVKLSLLSIMIILLIFSAISILSVIFNKLIMSCVALVQTIIICLWSSIQDLPLCFKSDKAIIKLLKKNRNLNDDGLKNSENYNIIIIKLVQEKKLDKVYDLLKIKQDKELIDYIFNLIINRLLNYKRFKDIPENKLKFDSFVDSILDNISLLENGKNNFFIDYDDVDKMSVHLARIFYNINNNRELLDESTKEKFERVFTSYFWLLFIKSEDIQKRIAFKTYQHLLCWSFRNCDLWVAKLFKKIFSNRVYSFGKYTLTNVLFSEISFVLFYYYNYENLISEEKKKEILEFINNVDKYSETEITYSWKELFSRNLYEYELTFSDLYHNIDAERFEFMLANRSKSCLFSQWQIAEWWIKCLLSSRNLYRYDFEKLENLSNEEQLILENYLDNLFKQNSDEFNLDGSFNKFNEFFGLSDNRIENQYIHEEISKKLFNFKNKVKKVKEQEELENNNINLKLKDLENYLRDEIVKYFDNLSFMDENIDLSSIKARGLYTLCDFFDFDSSKTLYLDMIKDCYSNDFRNIYDNELEKEIISMDNSINIDELKRCVDLKPLFTTEKIMYVLNTKEDIDINLKTQLIDIDKQITEINKNDLLPQYSYYNKDALTFNYEIETFELKELFEEDILKIIDNYKSDNGVYFYQGIQYNDKELIDLLRKKLFTMKVYIKYKIIYNKKNLCIFDPWGFYDRKKKR